MYHVPFQAQNQKILIPSYSPILKPSNRLLGQNQLLYPTQIIPNQNLQINQPHLQNIHNFQQLQQNRNSHMIIQNPSTINFAPNQVILGNEVRKTYTPGQLKLALNNPSITPNPIALQNVQQINPVQEQLLKNQRVVTTSYMNVNQSPVLGNSNLLTIQKPLNENYNNLVYVPIPNIDQNNNQDHNARNSLFKKTASLMTVKSLANLPYNEYPRAEFSTKPFFNISGYASNSYNGKIKSYNEDMVKIIVNYHKNTIPNNLFFAPNISYFGVFDGHGGDKCSKFLKNNLDNILFNTPTFPNNPIESIRLAFLGAESEFSRFAIQNGNLVDKSGSCALIALIINDILYAINLGDSRALYSRDGGKEFFQITRDHKPNDGKERRRIEKNGGKVYYANKTVVNGIEITLKEEQFGKGFTFPYRLDPSGLAVSYFI